MEIDIIKHEISVILTLYNSKEVCMRALNSLRKQSFKNFELIIVDDGSTDNAEIDLISHIKNNSNYKYIRRSNRGQPLSLNTGIVNSTGKYLTFLDSDDEYKPNHLEERVNYFIKNPAVDLIHSPASVVGDEKDFYVPDAKDNTKLIHLDDCIIGGTLFGKRKVFEELNGFKNIYSHDSEFYDRAKKVFNTAKLDSPTYVYYRNNPGSIISKLKKSIYEQ